jgi:hypothetical protein
MLECFNKFFENNETYTKKELLEFVKKCYDENYKNNEIKVKKDAETPKKIIGKYTIRPLTKSTKQEKQDLLQHILNLEKK